MRTSKPIDLVIIKGDHRYALRFIPGDEKKMLFRLMEYGSKDNEYNLTMREIARLIFMIKRQNGKGYGAEVLVRYFRETKSPSKSE